MAEFIYQITAFLYEVRAKTATWELDEPHAVLVIDPQTGAQ